MRDTRQIPGLTFAGGLTHIYMTPTLCTHITESLRLINVSRDDSVTVTCVPIAGLSKVFHPDSVRTDNSNHGTRRSSDLEHCNSQSCQLSSPYKLTTCLIDSELEAPINRPTKSVDANFFSYTVVIIISR